MQSKKIPSTHTKTNVDPLHFGKLWIDMVCFLLHINHLPYSNSPHPCLLSIIDACIKSNLHKHQNNDLFYYWQNFAKFQLENYDFNLLKKKKKKKIIEKMTQIFQIFLFYKRKFLVDRHT
jgi:hypothetical protein